MKNKLLIIASMFSILVLILSSFITAEMYAKQDVYFDYSNSNVIKETYYRFDDTSEDGYGNVFKIFLFFPFEIKENMPYVFSTSDGHTVSVDYCDFSNYQLKNNWSTSETAIPFIKGTSEINLTSRFTSITNDVYTAEVLNKDIVIIKMSCHYNNSNYLFYDNYLVGDFEDIMPSFPCLPCTTYEDALNTNNLNSTNGYSQISNIAKSNFQVWAIVFWIIKILILFIGLGLVLGVVYFFYTLIKSVAEYSK